MRYAVDVTVEAGVAFGGFQHRRDEFAGVDFRQIYRLVNVVEFLCAGDAVLTRLGQIKPAAAGGAQLGDHVLVVGLGHFDFDTGLFLEGLDNLVRGVSTPSQQAQFVSENLGGGE